jgi:hypothetical protein
LLSVRGRVGSQGAGCATWWIVTSYQKSA